MKEKRVEGRKRGQAQVAEANRGKSLRSYAREITREFRSKSDGKLARNSRT